MPWWLRSAHTFMHFFTLANLYLEELESKVLMTFSKATPSLWFNYMDDTWVKMKNLEVYRSSPNLVNRSIKLLREDVKEKGLHSDYENNLFWILLCSLRKTLRFTHFLTASINWNTNLGSSQHLVKTCSQSAVPWCSPRQMEKDLLKVSEETERNLINQWRWEQE